MASAYQNSVKIAHYSYHWFAILRVLLDKGRRSIIGCTSFPSKSSFLSLDISLFLCFVVERTHPFSTEMEKPAGFTFGVLEVTFHRRDAANTIAWFLW